MKQNFSSLHIWEGHLKEVQGKIITLQNFRVRAGPMQLFLVGFYLVFLNLLIVYIINYVFLLLFMIWTRSFLLTLHEVFICLLQI